MDDKELLTIKEFSKAVGKTPQAIYQQLNGRLKPFVQIVDNKKMLEKTALWDVFGMNRENLVQELSKDDHSIQANLEEVLYEILKEELEAKNEQIAILQAELAEERKHSREQADKIAVFADQAQKLQLAQMKPLITEDEEDLAETDIMPEKKGISSFFKRLFKSQSSI